MSTIETLRELVQHMEWADACIWKSVFESPAARSDSIIQERLCHIHMVQWAFLHVWLEQPLPEFIDAGKFTDIAAIASWGREAHAQIQQYVDRLDEAALQRIVRPPWTDEFEKYSGKVPAPINVAQTLLQLATHSAHHRGQVNTRLREVGSSPPYVDFIIWLWLAKPAPDVVSAHSEKLRN